MVNKEELAVEMKKLAEKFGFDRLVLVAESSDEVVQHVFQASSGFVALCACLLSRVATEPVKGEK